ncbi:protein ced-11 [Caerostris extrusa]|uniref:Protein ced-11 n=1 Tax=Caerostris extrusa TaxID=172846 RepID=A0AAV4VYL7_CAEEX|nr:protein ced-11 [Caerostris extrusa]
MTCIRLTRHPNGHSFLGLPADVCKVGRYYRPDCPNPGVWPHIFGLQYLLLLRLILLTMLYALLMLLMPSWLKKGRVFGSTKRYQLVVDFSNRLTFPAPLSVINYCLLFYNYIYGCICKRKDTNSDTLQLNEVDWAYWKTLASDYYEESFGEKEVENSTQWRMSKVLELQKALNDQRRHIRQLHAHLDELQIRIKRDHEYLEDQSIQISLAEYLQIKNVPQILSRISPYPYTKISRFPVSDKRVPWKYVWKDYDPIAYNKPSRDFPPEQRQFVDVDIQLLRETEGEDFRFPTFKWNFSILSPGGKFLDRQSWVKDQKGQHYVYEINEEGLPRNPLGRTGLRGRGCLPQWGPNHFMYAIITQWQEVENISYRDYLEVVLLITNENTGVSIPGGFVSTENPYSIFSTLFEGDISWTSEESMIAFFTSLAQSSESQKDPQQEDSPKSDDNESPQVVSESGKEPSSEKNLEKSVAGESPFIFQQLKRGYLDEAINTDQSWCEAEVWHFHYNVPNLVEEKFKADMLWLQLDEYALHKVSIGQAFYCIL